MMISVICIVNVTRSQKPAPNHAAALTGELPFDTAARKTMQTATSARANASGNHVSNHSESRRPARASQEFDAAESVMVGRGIIIRGCERRDAAARDARHLEELSRRPRAGCRFVDGQLRGSPVPARTERRRQVDAEIVRAHV